MEAYRVITDKRGVTYLRGATVEQKMAYYTDRRRKRECWPWKGKHNAYGYGLVSIANGWRSAHRTAYELAGHTIPPGMVIDHLCRTRDCVNPAHMEVVTRAENVLRGEGGPAVNARKTHCKNGHPLEGDNLWVRKASGYRHCRTCVNEYQRKRRAWSLTL